MPFTTLITFMINLVRKSLQVEIGSFTRFLDISSFSKQAFSQARKKLSPAVFKLLNEKLVTEFYTNNDFKTFKGLRLLSIDGSNLRLPEEDELYTKFGTHGRKDIRSVPLARVSTLYDVLNHITIHAIIAPFRAAERDMAKENINALCELNSPIHSNLTQDILDLVIFDRGYPSGAFMSFLLNKKKHFLMRAQGSSFSVVEQVIKNGEKDAIVDLPVLNFCQRKYTNVKSLFGVDKNSVLPVRILVFHLANNEREIIITSLIDQNNFTFNDIFMLYGMRWSIEENYKLYKCIAKLENFSGRSKLAIEQDLHATVFACNIASLLSQEAQEEIEREVSNKTRKYKYKIRLLPSKINNYMLGICLNALN